ncbi:MAG: branched-chain amino acid ABC transporter permease [Alphaproteobacteria bacterium]|nr:branched-chain amino acid ABC transporter permease [Alphaproteobacteria bacterium]
MSAQSNWLRPLALLLALAVIPVVFATGFQLFQLTMVAIYALSVLGKNLVSGYGGQVSLGQGAFFAVGAYTAAVLMDQYDWPYWATLPVAAITSGLVGLMLGLPALRLGGLYLALVTFALAISVPQLLKYKAFEAWTGGVQGIVINKPEPPFDLPLSADQWTYLFTLAVVAVFFFLARNLIDSRIGRSLKAIRDHALAAEAMGIELARYKTLVFGVGALFTGIGGALSAFAVAFVSPDSFSLALSLTLFVGMVIGGAATIQGAVYGAVFIVFAPNVSEAIFKGAPGAVYGIILILFMFFAPGGFASLVRRFGAKYLRRAKPA